MRVLGLCSYPVESAATRYRLAQFVDPLAEMGIELKISPFLDNQQFRGLYQNKSALQKFKRLPNSFLLRLMEIFRVGQYDVLFVQREAMFLGPAIFEWIYQNVVKIPLILDLDDATYIHYVSPTYGKVGSFFKFFGKTDKLIKRADTVVCGNRFIAKYVQKRGSKTEIIPTIVDTEKFKPVEKNNKIPVIGWIGTHSTFPFLESIFPVLQKLAQIHQFVLKIVGAGRKAIEIKGVEIENTPWNLEREIANFQSLDIGLYPITISASASNDWLLGKSGFKAIQYLAVGVPYVVTPVGVCAEIGRPGKTHFDAVTHEDWYNTLDRLLSNANLRREMGKDGRIYSLENFNLSLHAQKLAKVIQKTVENYKK